MLTTCLQDNIASSILGIGYRGFNCSWTQKTGEIANYKGKKHTGLIEFKPFKNGFWYSWCANCLGT